jgi:hypothetical protein
VLATGAFNVSSGYVGAYQDFGVLGIAMFAWLTMGGTVYAWRRQGILGSLIYAVLGQCAFFSIFFNHFFSLPNIFQILWFCIAVRGLSSERVASHSTVLNVPAQ